VAKITAIANQKGGVGKTTTAVNLTACLAVAGRRCLLVDLDPQGNATSGVGVEKAHRAGSYRLLTRGGVSAATTVVPTGLANLFLIPSGPLLAEAARISHLGYEEGNRLRHSLEPLLSEYDYIFLDCPPSIGPLTASALATCQHVLVPIQCEYYAMEGLAQILRAIERAKRSVNPGLSSISVLLTMFEDSLELAREVANDVREHLGAQAYHTVIPRDVALGEAPSHGLPVLEYAPRSKGARSYLELAKEVLQNG
jgi:chromosome partitioning protein